MNAAPSDCPFEDGPPHWVQRSLTHARRGKPATGRYALIVVAAGWLPLYVLAALDAIVNGAGGLRALTHDVGVDARYLIAAPLLVLAEAYCLPRLGATVNHFLHGDIVPEAEHDRVEHSLRHTRALLNRAGVDVVIVALAYTIVALIALPYGIERFPLWCRAAGVGPHFSPAGWWHILVSLPLLFILILRWLFRLALWTWLLLSISERNLRLVASHPDRAAGLGFVGISARAFAPVALALMTIAAGQSAQMVLATGVLPTPQILFNAGLLAALVVLFAAPTLVFTPSIIRAWHAGVHDYGTLASKLGVTFERKWLAPDAKIDRSALECEDFSATTDLYAVVATVYSVRFIPLTLADAALLSIAMLLPFVPVLFLAVPANTIWSTAKSLFF